MPDCSSPSGHTVYVCDAKQSGQVSLASLPLLEVKAVKNDLGYAWYKYHL